MKLIRESLEKPLGSDEQNDAVDEVEKAPTTPPTKSAHRDISGEHQTFARKTKNFGNDKTEPNYQTLLSLPSEEQKELSRPGRMARLHSAKYRNEQENQYLPLDWKALSKLEITSALTYIRDSGGLQPIEQFTALLTLLMSATPDDIQNTTIVESTFESSPNIQLCTASKTWTHAYPEIESRFMPTEKQAELLAPNTSNVILTMPDIMYDFLRIHETSIPALLERLKTQDATALVRNTCAKIASGTGARITPLKLRAALFFTGMKLTSDPMLTTHAIANNEFAPSVEDYYYSSDCTTVEKTYQNICEEVGATTCSPLNNAAGLRTGSLLYYPPSKHNHTLRKLIVDLEASKKNLENASLEDIIRFHNSFTCYTLWLLWCATGFRPRKFVPIDSHNIDGEWILIDDKNKPYNNTRLIRLPPLCKQQLKHYINHLKSLSVSLRKHHQNVYKKIAYLKAPAHQLNEIPLFFELHENNGTVDISLLKCKTVLQRVGIPEQLQENLARHWFDSGPRDYDVPAEWIAAATGHIGAGQRAWSTSATFSPSNEQFLKRWDSGLTRWLEELGFVNLPGMQVEGRFQLISIKVADCTVFNPKTPITPKYNVKAIVKEAIQAALSQSTSGDIYHDKAAQELAIEVIHDKCLDSALQLEKAHNLFLRLLEFKTKTNRSKLSFSYFASGEPTASLFQRNDLIHLRLAKNLRSKLPKLVENNYSNASEEARFAYTILSLIFLDGVTSKNTLSILLKNLKEHTFTHGNTYWLEWQEDHLLKRRILSFESTLLISTLNLSRKLSLARLNKAIANALFNSTLTEELSGFTKKDLTLERMLELANVWTRFHLPGNLCAYANGELKCASTPASNFIGLVSGYPHVASDTQCDGESKLVTVAHPKEANEAKSIDLLKSELSKVTGLVKELLTASAKSTDDGKASPAREVLHYRVGLIVDRWIQEKYPSKLIAIGLYAQTLLLEKNKNGYYASKTIDDYVRSVGIPLIETQADLDFLTADGDDLEDLYLDILDYDQTFKGRTRRAKRIVYLHNFCLRNFGLPVIDFGGLDPAFFAASKSSVHARVLTYTSYQKALELLKSANPGDPQIMTLSLALILMFRFKLRLSEAISRTTDDLAFNASTVTLLVRTNKLGKLKTPAGRRQVLNWYLDEYELSVVNNRLNFLNARFNEKECALFASTDDPWRLVSRSSLSKKLLELLKSVSGDQTFRGHHARHTNASTITNDLTCTNNPKGIQGWIDTHCSDFSLNTLGAEFPSRRAAYSLASQMGHRSPLTTFESYSHCHEFALYDQFKGHREKPLKHASVARIVKQSQTSIRQDAHRQESREAFESTVLRKRICSKNFTNVDFEILDLNKIDQIAEITHILSLSELESFLLKAESGANAIELASFYPVEVDTAETIINLHKDFQETLRTDFSSTAKSVRFSTSGKFTLKQQLKIIIERYSQQKEFILNANIWFENFHSPLSGLTIINEKDCLAFIAWLNTFPESISVQIHTKQSYEKETSAWIINNAINARVIANSEHYQSQITQKGRRIIAPQIFIDIDNVDSQKRVNMMPAFHHAMYLALLRSKAYGL
ncbi:hypothetical protein A3742_15565 [Oleiphilus sp. HI0071]|nr:hypothetical protein A3737_07085 [Oleiphilus sp. HI0065]KZY90007.1 hypothetical protein A3742_15565 [Oleiphilus sp. HI0071]KZZ49658.1 hypothetical protein A3760_14790 [Oleiphilus sp. HI0122]